MIAQENTTAYIDAANLHKGVQEMGWELDYRRFRVWLHERYSVERAYLFMGLVPKYKDMYTRLQEAGFTLVFKEVTMDGDGRVKGNCDADLVLWAVRDAFEHATQRAVLVSSDGDYAGLVKFLLERQQFATVLSPGSKCSILLKRTNASIAYLSQQRTKLEHRK